MVLCFKTNSFLLYNTLDGLISIDILNLLNLISMFPKTLSERVLYTMIYTPFIFLKDYPLSESNFFYIYT